MSNVNDNYEQKLDEQMPESVKSQAEIYDDEVAAFKAELEKVTDVKELEKMEEEIGKLIDENKESLKTVEYDLPASATFRGTLTTREKVGQYVADFIAAQEVGWQMTLGWYDLITFWKNMKDTGKITYEYYDATLNILGKLRYKGEEQLRRILTCNALFAGAHEAYLKNITYTYYLADKHDAILQRMDAINALTQPITQ